MIEIINPNGVSVLENEYGLYPGTLEYNRVIRQRSGDGEFMYEYGVVSDSNVDPEIDPVNVPIAFTRVFYPNCHQKEYEFNLQGNGVRESEVIISDVSGLLETIITSYRYNEDGLLVEKTLPDGRLIRYHYQREEYAQLNNGRLFRSNSCRKTNIWKRIEEN